MISLSITFLLASMIIDAFDGTRFKSAAFLIYLAIRGAIFLYNVYSGISQGKSYFKDIVLNLAVIRENIISKYLVWSKNRKEVKPIENKVETKIEDKEGAVTNESNQNETELPNREIESTG